MDGEKSTNKWNGANSVNFNPKTDFLHYSPTFTHKIFLKSLSEKDYKFPLINICSKHHTNTGLFFAYCKYFGQPRKVFWYHP